MAKHFTEQANLFSIKPEGETSSHITQVYSTLDIFTTEY